MSSDELQAMPLTGLSVLVVDDEADARELAAGFYGHLAKPVNAVRLLQMLAEVAAR